MPSQLNSQKFPEISQTFLLHKCNDGTMTAQCTICSALYEAEDTVCSCYVTDMVGNVCVELIQKIHYYGSR